MLSPRNFMQEAPTDGTSETACGLAVLERRRQMAALVTCTPRTSWVVTATTHLSDWIIENSTFKNYVPTESGCGVDHSEALYMGARSSNGIIRNNVFANNANTAHIFFTWWGSGCTGYSPACSPDNICIEGNSFGQTWTGSAPPGAYFDISSREELPDSLGISIDPAQGASVAGASSWNRICP